MRSYCRVDSLDPLLKEILIPNMLNRRQRGELKIDEIETHIQQPTLLQIDCWRMSYQKTQSRAEMLALNDFILNRTRAGTHRSQIKNSFGSQHVHLSVPYLSEQSSWDWLCTEVTESASQCSE